MAIIFNGNESPNAIYFNGQQCEKVYRKTKSSSTNVLIWDALDSFSPTKHPVLPEGFKSCRWIQPMKTHISGNTITDAKCEFTGRERVRIEFEIIDLISEPKYYSGCLFGFYKSQTVSGKTAYRQYSMYYDADGYLCYDYNEFRYTLNIGEKMAWPKCEGKVFCADMQANKFYFNNIYKSNAPKAIYTKISDEFVIFGSNVTASSILSTGGPLPYKLYLLEIYDEYGVLMHQYVPAVRESDNKAGLYDYVTNNQLFTIDPNKYVYDWEKVIIAGPYDE